MRGRRWRLGWKGWRWEGRRDIITDEGEIETTKQTRADTNKGYVIEDWEEMSRVGMRMEGREYLLLSANILYTPGSLPC